MKKTLIILITILFGTLFSTTCMAVDIMGVSIHGFLSQGYLTTSDTDFTFSEVGINFSKELTDDMHIGIQIFAQNFNQSDKLDIDVDWAFADYRLKDWLGMRFGQMKTPHGLYNETRDIDMLRNPVFLPESVYQELSDDIFSDFYVSDLYLSLQGIDARELYLSLIGIGLYGFVELDYLGDLSYQVMFGTQNVDMDNKTGERQVQRFIDALIGVKLPNAGFLENDSIDVDYKYATNLIWDTPLEGLRLGASLDDIKMTAFSHFTDDVIVPSDIGDIPIAAAGDEASVKYKKLQSWVGSLEYTWHDFTFMAEYIKTFKEYDVTTAITGTDRKKSNPWGWYLGGTYRFIEWFELGGYYSRSENDDMDLVSLLPPIDYFFYFNDYCLTARFDINAYFTIKLEAHQLEGSYANQTADQFFTMDHTKVKKEWNMYTAQVTVAF